MEYLAQAGEVFDVYRQKVQDGMAPAPRVHFNFMARGEALSNPYLIHESQRLFDALRGMARAYGVEEVRFNVSSIYPVSTSASPNDGPVELTTILADPDSELYYSLYSLDNAFRKRWLPHAINPLIALRKIAEYQEATGRRTTLHWAFIKDQNDRLEDVASIIETVLAFKLKVKFNLVRYNPYDARYGVESSEEVLQDRFALLAEAFQDSDSRIVPRVGYDVAASCGCFLTP
jgi:adenine C2-methylase RlmN of 23S rRNA A2503 and tRNA A37